MELIKDFLSDPLAYDYLRAFHIISFVAWMAGLLYLPRLFVYHAQTEKGSETSETFKIMERRLYKFIMSPAMMAAWAFGLLMIFANPALFQNGWLHVKLTAVVLLTGVHFVFKRFLKRFAADENEKPDSFYRVWNEVPTVLLVIIVIMAVAEPF